jgi:hypothetical protein
VCAVGVALGDDRILVVAASLRDANIEQVASITYPRVDKALQRLPSA